MKNFFYIFACFSLLGCSENIQEENQESDSIPVEEESTANVSIEHADTVANEINEWNGEYVIYNGNYFSIEYPSNFIASPTQPIDNFDDYEFIATDEATFTSPDSAVEFFVYSPLWNGEPEFYLEFQENEELTFEKEVTDTNDYGLVQTIQWMTISDKANQYSRSYVSTKTESTFLVFGIKSINDTAYEKYKDTYLRFKESLEQFADA